MHTLYRCFCLLVATAFSLCSLTSCYFNSAQTFFDEASHKAAVFTSDIKPGHSVYQSRKTGRYYVELKHYRADKPLILQYPTPSQHSSEEKLSYRGKVIVEVPADYANFLMGVSGYVYPAFLAPTDYDADFKKKCDAYRVQVSPPEVRANYTYESPYAGWWYLFGAIDWVCVDVPITCVENLCAGIFAVMAAADYAEKNPSYQYSGGSGGGGSYVDNEEYLNMLNDAAIRSNNPNNW